MLQEKMIVLHTSDWHIGKKLKERDRLPEQVQALDEIAGICEREGVEVVLVAGDVFDTYTPSADAEEVFYRAVKKIAGDKRTVVLIGGNHDDCVRLSAAAPLASENGIYIFGNRKRCFLPDSRPVRVERAGENWLLLANQKGEKLYINALPYPNEARLGEEKTDEKYEEKIARWIAAGEAGYEEGAYHVLLTHLFVCGGLTSESERDIDLGGARVVPIDVLPKEGYVALGHLHKKQVIHGNLVYSGSILPYAFDEAGGEKGVFLLDTASNEAPRFLPLESGKKLVRLECNGVEDGISLLRRYENAWIELTLHLDSPLTRAEYHALTEANEGLVSLIAKVKEQAGEGERVSREGLSPEELFKLFYARKYGTEPNEDLTQAFLSLFSEEA